MQQDKFQRYELAVYIVVGLLATILLLVGTFIIVDSVMSDFVRSIAAELFGVVAIFVILKFFFLNSSNETKEEKIATALNNLNKMADVVQDITPMIRSSKSQLQHLRDDVEKIKNASILSEQVKIGEKLIEIQKSVSGIDTDIDTLTKKISDEIETKYDKLLLIVGSKFTSEIDKSHTELRRAIEHELASFKQHKSSQESTDKY